MTDRIKARDFAKELHCGAKAIDSTLVTYKKDGTPFVHSLSISRVSIDGVEYLLTESEESVSLDVARVLFTSSAAVARYTPDRKELAWVQLARRTSAWKPGMQHHDASRLLVGC